MTRALIACLLVLVPCQLQAQASGTEGRRADLATFRRGFFSVDNSYSTTARAEAEARLRTLESRVDHVGPIEFELELARIVALADNGHTNSPAQWRSRRYARVPLRLVPFGDQFYVLRADTGNADLLGARLLAIDGRPIAQVRTVVHTLFGGTASWRDRHAPLVFESPDQLQFLGITTSPTRATYRFGLRDGRTIERAIVADAPDPNRDAATTSRWLYAEAMPADSARWTPSGRTAPAPWAFTEPNRLFRLRHDDALQATIVQLRSNVDGNGQSIQAFLDSASTAIRNRRPQHVILDLRLNGGGNLNNTRDFVQSLPNLVSGRIFVLTSPWTFSAAISTAGYLEQAGKDRVTIVGEMVGDRLDFWAEGSFLRLPNTNVGMSYSTQRHDYRNGCKAYRDCHGPVVRNPIAVESLEPDIDAPLTIESVIAGRDPGMEAIARALGRSR